MSENRTWCVCGDPLAHNIVHRADGPCYAYTAPQAECAPRAKERLWLMVADNFTREEFEQAFVECAPRAECHIDKYSSRICENGTLSCDVEHPRADADTAGEKPEKWSDKTIACDECRLTWGESHMLSDIRSGRVAINAVGASNEPADAEKDAALTDEQIIAIESEMFPDGIGFYDSDIIEFARAILAANKEPQ